MAGRQVKPGNVCPSDARALFPTPQQALTYEARIAYAPLVTQCQPIRLKTALGMRDVVERNCSGKSFSDGVVLSTLTEPQGAAGVAATAVPFA